MERRFVSCNNRIRMTELFNTYTISEKEKNEEFLQSKKSGLIPDIKNDIYIREGYGALVGECSLNCKTIYDLLNFDVDDWGKKKIFHSKFYYKIRNKIRKFFGKPIFDDYFGYKKYVDEGYQLVVGPGGWVDGIPLDNGVYCKNYEEILKKLEAEGKKGEIRNPVNNKQNYTKKENLEDTTKSENNSNNEKEQIFINGIYDLVLTNQYIRSLNKFILDSGCCNFYIISAKHLLDISADLKNRLSKLMNFYFSNNHDSYSNELKEFTDYCNSNDFKIKLLNVIKSRNIDKNSITNLNNNISNLSSRKKS